MTNLNSHQPASESVLDTFGEVVSAALMFLTGTLALITLATI